MLGNSSVADILVWPAIVGGVLFVTVFWLWMLMDCARSEPRGHRFVWLLVILFSHWIGAVIYFFARRPQRIMEVGR